VLLGLEIRLLLRMIEKTSDRITNKDTDNTSDVTIYKNYNNITDLIIIRIIIEIASKNIFRFVDTYYLRDTLDIKMLHQNISI
jgi:hypothetical protein